jgi:hypothetical protein
MSKRMTALGTAGRLVRGNTAKIHIHMCVVKS